jgi:beta-lactamase regulating signal transducer with metallopeptidase domain
MNPAFCLHFAGTFLSYSLQVGIAYLACCLLNRLLRQPQHRFFMWMAFLVGSGTYWLSLLWSERSGFSSTAAAAPQLPAGSAPVWAHSFLVPLNWSHSILVAGKAIGLAYVLVVVALAGVAAWKHFQLRLLLRHATQPSPALAALFDETCRELKVSRSRLLILPGLGSPATACWWKPRILLPEVCEQFGATQQLAGVLYHELVHVARRDYLWSALSDLICRLLFFHPAARQARKQLRLQGELACDIAVIKARPGHRADYADSLAYFVRLQILNDGVSLAVDFAASASTLGTRIRTILQPTQPLPWWKRIVRATAALALVFAVGVISSELKIFLDFTSPAPVEAASRVPTTTHMASSHVRSSRTQGHGSPAQRQAKVEDSLTRLRVRPSIRTTPAYSLTASRNSRLDAEPGDPDRQGWSEPTPPVRTVTSEVLSAARQIPVGKLPRRSDHDRDDH